jgi:hypothetical protein
VLSSGSFGSRFFLGGLHPASRWIDTPVPGASDRQLIQEPQAQADKKPQAQYS